MGIVHRKLYQGGNLHQVEMQDYFKNLSESLLETFDAWEQIDIQINMDMLDLDIEKAIPLGLIVNELLTNAWKYAFPKDRIGNKKGVIQLSLNQINEQLLRLVVADNGVGKNPTAPIQGTGFGSQLIGLLTQQLNGTMKEENEKGTRFIFDFKLTT